MREMWLGLAILLLLAGGAPVAAQAPPATAEAAKLLEAGPADRVLGKREAPITIVEYASLTCPHCRHFEVEVLPQIKQKWIDSGKVKLILRDFPLDEPGLRAAMVARCAPPERFHALIGTFFQTQEQWATAPDYRAALEKLAKLGGVSSKDFAACVSDKAAENRVIESRFVAAKQLGVDSTPTFFINGSKFTGNPTFEAFDQLLTNLAAKS